MSRFALALVWLSVVAGIWAQTQPSQTPLSESRVIHLLEGGVSPKRVEALARERGVGFEMTKEAEADLRQAGATDALLSVLRELEPKPTAAAPSSKQASKRDAAYPNPAVPTYRLATGSLDKTAKVWDAASGQELLTLRGHDKSVDSVAWSPAP